MQATQPKPWNKTHIKQCEIQTQQALLSDEATLVSFSQDFGKIIQSQPCAVAMPQTVEQIQSLILFANQQQLSLAVRGNGLSQCGQSLPHSGGLTLSMQHFNKPLQQSGDTIWVQANTCWSDLLTVSLNASYAPYVLPYNCNLSVGGVLSAGGVGASSFKFGSINAHVEAMEVIDGLGKKHLVTNHSPLFHACLSGQGRFGVITKAQIKLRPVKSKVKTVCLVYANQEQWFADMQQAKGQVDYMELFCSPSIQGAKLVDEKRMPMAQWLYGMHLSVEYDEIAPEAEVVIRNLNPWQLIHQQEESLSSYLLRHNSRFDVMKRLGQWELAHPWYECFVSTTVLKEVLTDLLDSLPLHYASLVHVAPVAQQGARFLMLPDDDSLCSLMILNPGVSEPLKDSALQAIKALDDCLLPLGGKRYLSGFLGEALPESYWASHFGKQHADWLALKKQFDPGGVFSSILHPA